MTSDVAASGGPKTTSASAKMEQTTKVARAAIDQEVAAREKKTARLREARLQMEAERAAEPPAAPAKRTRAAKK